MELNIKITGKRDLQAQWSGKSFESLDELIKNLSKISENLDKITLEGESESYTFSRQVYLLINLLNQLTSADVEVNDKIISKKDIVVPEYKSNI